MKDGVLMLQVQKDIKDSESKVSFPPTLFNLTFLDSSSSEQNQCFVEEGWEYKEEGGRYIEESLADPR